jgi:uncharacterized linocin/CFP29 family protein
MVLGAQGGLPYGSVAHRLLSNGLNISALRTNDVLRKEEWLLFDTTVVEIARANLIGISDLMSANLRMPIPNAMGITVVQHETVSDMSPASVDMSGLTEAEHDRLLFSPVNIPLPIVHKDFRLSLRNLESGRRLGIPLDTAMAATAARRVSDMLESILFAGASITSGGGTIQGYTNFTARNTGSVTITWVTATGEQIVTDVIAMMNALIGDNFYGPYQIYVPVAVYVNMLKDFKAASDKSTIQRVLEIPNIRGVKATTQLAGTNILMVQFSRDVIEMLDGLQPTTVMWETHGGMLVHFKVLAIMVPRLKNDQEGRSGVAHYS